MSPAEALIRDRLTERRQQLAGVPDLAVNPELVGLLMQVDSALERLDGGTYGICPVCRDTVESDRLLTNPAVSVCLGCLSEEQRLALEHDLTTAASIQSALLPPVRTAADGWEAQRVYEPLGPVSGDYIDLIEPADGDGLLVAFGDVAGKGIAAAMVMTHLNALLRSLAGPAVSLEELLRRANCMMVEATTAASYVTLVIARLHADGSVEIGNAGHEPPVIARAGGVELVPTTGMPIGLFPSGSFHTYRTRLEPGDALVLFTDGVSEAADEQGSEYGRRRVARLAGETRGRGVEEILRSALEDLDRFRGAAERSDDLSMMAVERLERTS